MILPMGFASLLFWSSVLITPVRGSLENRVTVTTVIDSATLDARLSIRPREIVIGRKTDVAGLTELAGFPGYFVYVPKNCLGSRRVPLVVLLHGGGRTAIQEIKKFSVLADTYGMIVLAANATQRGRWDVIGSVLSNPNTYTTRASGILVSTFPEVDVQKIDSALQIVLRTHAIDPTRIALLGFSDGGSYSLFLGRNNLDVFSRVAALSALIPFDGVGPKNTTTQFFISAGLDEPDMVKQTLQIGRALHNSGNPVISQLDFRGHVDEVADEDIVWQWLRDSWANPVLTKTTMPSISDTIVLTDTIVRKLLTLWKPLKRLPDSIRIATRTTYSKRLVIPVDTFWTTMLLMDLPSLAAKYSYVANALKQAELTAAMAATYRAAVLGVDMAQRAKIVVATSGVTSKGSLSSLFASVSSTSVLGKNLLLFQRNRLLWEELKQSGVLLGP